MKRIRKEVRRETFCNFICFSRLSAILRNLFNFYKPRLCSVHCATHRQTIDRREWIHEKARWCFNDDLREIEMMGELPSSSSKARWTRRIDGVHSLLHFKFGFRRMAVTHSRRIQSPNLFVSWPLTNLCIVGMFSNCEGRPVLMTRSVKVVSLSAIIQMVTCAADVISSGK